MTWKEIVDFTIDEHFKDIESQEEAAKLTKLINSVIDNLVNKESLLIITKEDEVQENQSLTLNSNYSGSDII